MICLRRKRKPPFLIGFKIWRWKPLPPALALINFRPGWRIYRVMQALLGKPDRIGRLKVKKKRRRGWAKVTFPLWLRLPQSRPLNRPRRSEA
jgi:hypothetical protein